MTKVNELTVLVQGGQVGALCRMKDGYIQMHVQRHVHSLVCSMLGKVNNRVIVKDVYNL